MKPRAIVKITNINTSTTHEMMPLDMTITKKGHGEADTANITIENTDQKFTDALYSYLPKYIECFITYEEWDYKWYKLFTGYTDPSKIHVGDDSSTYSIESRSKLSILIEDPVTYKWEGNNAYLHKVITDLNSGYFKLNLNCPNHYLGKLIMENESRWEKIVELANDFGLDTYLTIDDVLYFGIWRSTQSSVYQFLVGYPRKKELLNANVKSIDIEHQSTQYPESKIEVVRWNEDKKLYSGTEASIFKRLTGKHKLKVVDNKYITSNAMAKELADWILWKIEKSYITATIVSPGIPYIESDQVIEVVNMGRYSGFYWTKEITHNYNSSEYTMTVIAETRDPKERFRNG